MPIDFPQLTFPELDLVGFSIVFLQAVSQIEETIPRDFLVFVHDDCR